MNNASQKQRLAEFFGTVAFTVYADLNCPYCYALNERLFAAGQEHQVDFRLVQHAPGIQGEQMNIASISELTAEVAEVRRRVPSTEINLPLFRPSSAPATALLYEIGRHDPVQAVLLRRRVFSALWVEGQDISNPAVLAALLLELEIELPSRENLSNRELSAWQSEWENNTEFNRNIPVLISERGETVIGFLLEPELDSFLQSGSLVSDQAMGGNYQAQNKQRVLVLDNDASSLRTIIEQMHDTQVEVAGDLIGLIAHARNLGMPDLLMVNTALVGNTLERDWWRNSTNSDPDPEIPIIHILEELTVETEASAFKSGATDIISRPFHPRLLRSRLNSHLQARRAQKRVITNTTIDALTSVSNRREFDARLLSEWGRGARDDGYLALLLIDIDRLRAYNDSHGHLSGDECLCRVARRLGSCLQRPGDFVARYHGGLFAALLPGAMTRNALKVAQDCQRAVADAGINHPASPIATHLTVSIGVTAMKPQYDKSCTLIIEQAEIALYQAKRNLQDRICAFEQEAGPYATAET